MKQTNTHRMSVFEMWFINLAFNMKANSGTGVGAYRASPNLPVKSSPLPTCLQCSHSLKSQAT